MSFTIHESDALTQEQADEIIAEYPGNEVVLVYGDTLVWRREPIPHVVKLAAPPHPFALEGHLDTIGVPKPRIVLNMRETEGDNRG